VSPDYENTLTQTTTEDTNDSTSDDNKPEKVEEDDECDILALTEALRTTISEAGEYIHSQPPLSPRDIEAFWAYIRYHAHKPRSRNTAAKNNISKAANKNKNNSARPPPSFLSFVRPTDDAEQEPPVDPPNTKRCIAGKPLGKIISPRDKHYGRSLCDKHGEAGVYWENVGIRGGEYADECAKKEHRCCACVAP
jgi:hypothetical protein